MYHNWYYDSNGNTKTHNRARKCSICRENPKCGCALPFRKQRKTRYIKHIENKPIFFMSIIFNKMFNLKEKT